MTANTMTAYQTYLQNELSVNGETKILGGRTGRISLRLGGLLRLLEP